jgi:hypothetical protein
MSYSISATAKSAAFAEETSEAFLVLLQITAPSLAATINVVNNYSNITSNGTEYIGFPFDITIPDESESQMPSAKLTIDNVDRQIVEAVRMLTETANISISVILASSPNTIERGPYSMQMRNVEYDGINVSADLLSDDIFNEPYPGKAFTPTNWPGLFP